MRNLLFVDDNTLLLKALSMVFATHFKVKSFAKSTEAIEYIENNKNELDIIISDFKMPIFNGIDVLKKVRDLKPDTIRILLTGYSEYSVISENKDIYDIVLDKNVYKDQNQIIDIINSISEKKAVK